MQAPHLNQTLSECLTQNEVTHGISLLLSVLFHFLDIEDHFVKTKIGSKGSQETWTGIETQHQNFKRIFNEVMK